MVSEYFFYFYTEVILFCMNKAVELITAWGTFEEQYPDSNLEEFCRHYLAHQREKIHQNKSSAPCIGPVTPDGKLMQLIGRIFKLHAFYTGAALEGTGIKLVEEFSLLNTVQGLREPRKTEAVYAVLMELSTGTDMLNRLKKLGYLTETNDSEDKRSKRLKITPKGERVMATCRSRIAQLAELMFHDLSEDDKVLCFQILKGVEMKFAAIWQSHKGKRFEEIYEAIVGSPPVVNRG